jgi:hypothetical protein
MGVLLVLFAAVFFWLSFRYADQAARYDGKPELIPSAYFSEGKYDKLRDVAIDCYRLQDEIHVRSMQGSSNFSLQAASFGGVLGALFFFNAWAFRKYAQPDATSRSNL